MAKKPVNMQYQRTTLETLETKYYATDDVDRVALLQDFVGEEKILAAKEIFGFILSDCYYYDPAYFADFVAEVCEIAKTKYNS